MNVQIKLINKIVNNQVTSYWPSYRSEVCCIGPRRIAQLQVLGLLYWASASPRANTANLGPVTGPIRNYLINNTIVIKPMKRLYISTDKYRYRKLNILKGQPNVN